MAGDRWREAEPPASGSTKNDGEESEMAFDPTPHVMKVKGGQLYLPVKYRLMWLREEHPEAEISTEMVHLDTEKQLAVFRAQVTVPGRGIASGYGSETERDFPAGWIEKAETKAIGRALAALGFGTQFAVELDEGERIVDSPVAQVPRRPERRDLKVVPDERAAVLREQVEAGLASDADAASKLPKAAGEMTADELEKTLIWLRNRSKRSG